MRLIRVCLVAAVVMVVGCAGDDDAAPPLVVGTTTTVAVTVAEVPVPTDATGVPGLDAADPSCAAWAVYAGTVQTLSVAAAFGELDDVALARLEVVAAPALLQSLESINDEWPASIIDERAVVFAGSLGGWRERSAAVLDQMRAQGVDDDDAMAMADAWRTTLAQRDPAEPVPADPALEATLWAVIDPSAAAVVAGLGVFTADPVLRRPQVDGPQTGAYLAENCPDLAASGVGDAL